MRMGKSGLGTEDLGDGREGENGRERRDWMKLEMGFEIYLQMLLRKSKWLLKWKDTGGINTAF